MGAIAPLPPSPATPMHVADADNGTFTINDLKQAVLMPGVSTVAVHSPDGAATLRCSQTNGEITPKRQWYISS
jgi:hypothetical protein